jgi:ribose transport system substrate-binding protein
MTLEYVKSGYINSTLCNKTAMQAYLAIALLEDYKRFGYANVPVSADNKDAKVSVFPERVVTGTFVITAANVDKFRHENMDTYNTSRYKK